MFLSPFEQFELSLLFPIKIGSFDVSITNLTVFFFLIVGIIFSALALTTKRTAFLPNNWQNFIELLYTFVLGLIVEQSGSKRAKTFLPFIFILFLFIMLANLIGLTPYAFTVTGHLSVTFFFALSFFIAWVLLALRNLGLSFFKVFLPSGIPNWLAPLLVVIEVLSFFLRPISLSVRLFANMLAGHILLFIIGSATLFLIKFTVLGSIFPFAFIVVFMILEVGIALLQSYVFIILLCIYLHDSYIAGH